MVTLLIFVTDIIKQYRCLAYHVGIRVILLLNAEKANVSIKKLLKISAIIDSAITHLMHYR